MAASSSFEDQLSDGNPSCTIFSSQLCAKVRKTYTIKKQREKWTEQEHDKFVEALKLHGRAWRHIEEHIGTKTAVQIRSHAQKFFSKVVRDSTDSTSSAVIIEIPPPRPKRKPAHPYPRKTNTQTVIKTGTGRKTVVIMDPKRSLSPTLSVSEQEQHQSPTSANSSSPSPFSSPNANLSVFESDLSPKPNRSKTQTLKLFGTTVLVDMSNTDPIEKEEVFTSTHSSISANLDQVYYILIPNEKLISNPNQNEPSYPIHQPVALRKSPTCLTTTTTSSSCSNVENYDVSKEVESESRGMLLKNNIRSLSWEKRRRNCSKWEEKGFVPYKRCIVRDAQSADSVVDGRIGLCL